MRKNIQGELFVDDMSLSVAKKKSKGKERNLDVTGPYFIGGLDTDAVSQATNILKVKLLFQS